MICQASHAGTLWTVTDTTPGAGELPSCFADDLGWLLAQCFRAHAVALEDVVAGLPHGPRGFQALSGAVHGSARNQAELAKQLGVDRTVMVYLVDDLVKAGLVERVTDPADRRSKLIRATAAGEARLAEVQAAIDAAESQILEPLSPADRTRLRSMLQTIVARHISPDGRRAGPCDIADQVAEGCQ
jgi:DNA-binding MarR family transcriptional regulator